MKKTKLAILILPIILSSNISLAKENLFAPKTSGISKEEFNQKLNIELEKQRYNLEDQFSKQMQSLKEDIQKEQREQLSKLLQNLPKSSKNSVVLTQPKQKDNSEYNDEIEIMFQNNNNEALDKEVKDLNNEYGYEDLKFVSITNNMKIYKNAQGNYIIKDMDFDFNKYKEEEKKKQNRNRIEQ